HSTSTLDACHEGSRRNRTLSPLRIQRRKCPLRPEHYLTNPSKLGIKSHCWRSRCRPMLKNALLLLAIAVVAAGCGFGPSEPTYSVVGRIVDVDGRGVPGVTVVAQGANAIAQTGPDGVWRIDGLRGRVTIVPHLEGSRFEPMSHTVTAGTENLRFQLVPSISGRIVNVQGAGVAGVVV